MKGYEIVLGTVGDRQVAALVIDGRLEDLITDSDAPCPGTVYRAKVTRTVSSGVFVDTGEGSGFLRGGDQAPGTMVTVQVAGYAEPGKAIPVTARLTFRARLAVATPGAPGVNVSKKIGAARRAALRDLAGAVCDDPSLGIILRTQAEYADDAQIQKDLKAVVGQAGQVRDAPQDRLGKILDGPGPWALITGDWPPAAVRFGAVEEYLDHAGSVDFALRNGASMTVETTRALVAVDVNTGPDTSPAAGLRANINAARDLPRVLRIKGLGGQIVVDFAPMPKKDRKSVEAALVTALRRDGVDTNLVGWTGLGLFEIQRKRARCPLTLG